MLTRLEIHGFKNLLNFEINFGALTCIAGPNAVGKSNIFDTIRFLSLLTDHTIMEAALKIRGEDAATANMEDLFWTDGKNRIQRFKIAAEMIVPKEVHDDFGRKASATSTFLRYEIEITYEPPSPEATLGALRLHSESLKYITEKDALIHMPFPHSAKDFRKSSVRNKRRSPAGFISTEVTSKGKTEILVHQDGGSRGIPLRSPARAAPRTIVGTSNTSSTPTVLAARREMQRWRVLALEPSAMRRADRFQDHHHISHDGAHMPATLHRLIRESDDDEDIAGIIANELTGLVSVQRVGVDRDEARQLLTLYVEEIDNRRLPAMSLSDGTLRFLALAIINQDPQAAGVICMEEPENGIHPGKIQSMVGLLYSLSVDTGESLNADNPMRQVIIASHSPALVQLIDHQDLLLAKTARIRGPFGQPTTTLRCLPQNKTWRARGSHNSVGKYALIEYLTNPPRSQFSLELTP